MLKNATKTRNVDNILLKKHPITRKNVDALVNIVLNVEVLLQRPSDKLAKEDLSLAVAKKDQNIKEFVINISLRIYIVHTCMFHTQ